MCVLGWNCGRPQRLGSEGGETLLWTVRGRAEVSVDGKEGGETYKMGEDEVSLFYYCFLYNREHSFSVYDFISTVLCGNAVSCAFLD